MRAEVAPRCDIDAARSAKPYPMPTEGQQIASTEVALPANTSPPPLSPSPDAHHQANTCYLRLLNLHTFQYVQVSLFLLSPY